MAGRLPWEDFLSGHFRGPLSSLHGPEHQTYEIPHGWKVFLEKLFLQTLNPSGLLSQDTRRGTEKGEVTRVLGKGFLNWAPTEINNSLSPI